MEISKRLEAITQLISKGNIVADIGCDHGYIPIYLITNKIAPKVYAMDINKGPFEKAKQHIAGYGLSAFIETRLSDGMTQLKIGEANSVVIAGMGGGLVIKILEQDKRLWNDIYEFILQPQSEIHKVREYLQQNGFEIVNENMIYEDGKYYPMMKAVRGDRREYSREELYFGPHLIAHKNSILKQYIKEQIRTKEKIVVHIGEKLEANNSKIILLKEELEMFNEVYRNL